MASCLQAGIAPHPPGTLSSGAKWERGVRLELSETLVSQIFICEFLCSSERQFVEIGLKFNFGKKIHFSLSCKTVFVKSLAFTVSPFSKV